MQEFGALFGLLFVALAIAALAKRFDQPYPIALLVGGILLAFIPGAPVPRLNPDMVFFLLLPPILCEAAYFTSWRDFWKWRRPILLLALGLVTATSAVVAALCVFLIPGMSWSVGFVLGAIVSPPDAAAATSIIRGLRLPRRIVQIIEGESLVNDASALTLYRFAVAAVVTGTFSWGDALLSFAWLAVGGTAIGLAIGFAFTKIYRWIKDPEVEIIATFLVAYSSYWVAEVVHASGVLAVVAAGLWLGRCGPELFGATTRIRAHAVWQTAIFLVNVGIFLLIGLQLPSLLASLRGYPLDDVIVWCVAISFGVIAIRLLWMFPGAYLPRALSKRIRELEPRPSWQSVTIIGWTGLRGVVSLAAAMALPEETATGLPFPYRTLILLMTFAVILATLIVQGMTLRPVIRWLGIPQDHTSEEEELFARVHTTERVLDRLAELERIEAAPRPVVERIRGYFEDRAAELRARLEIETGGAAIENQPEEFRSLAEQRLWYEVVRTERQALLDLRRQNKIGDEVLHAMERDTDLLEARIAVR
jgi:CPA1 family monovalent cation:H+ antiporter